MRRAVVTCDAKDISAIRPSVVSLEMLWKHQSLHLGMPVSRDLPVDLQLFICRWALSKRNDFLIAHEVLCVDRTRQGRERTAENSVCRFAILRAATRFMPSWTISALGSRPEHWRRKRRHEQRPNQIRERMRASRRRAVICLSAVLTSLVLSHSARSADSAEDLAKKLSNPVASMISVPMQYNADFNIGSADGTKQTLNIQPVIPTGLNKQWNLITRVIMPVVAQDDISGESGSQFGLGDTTPTFFFSPKKPTAGGWILAAGPVFLLPTATDDLLGTEKWGAGPSVLGLKQTGNGWTYGVLANHIWSVAGSSERAEISSTFIQPFLAKQFAGARTATVNFESTYDWYGETWNLPLNLTYSKVVRLGDQTVSFAGGTRYYFETPGDGPDWGIRFVITFLFPEN